MALRSTSSETTAAPNDLSERIKRVHGDKGRQWLANLPALLSEYQERWSLELDEPFAELSYNLVIPGRTSQGDEVVLKLGVPCRELTTEALALSFFNSEGSVRLLEHDESVGVLLIERARPGTPLHELQHDSEAIITAAKLMQRLWQDPPAGHSFPSLAVWFQAFERLRNRSDAQHASLPLELIARGERTFHDLNTSTERTVILHADLHHANILLSASRGWMAIDPKGIAGDPGYEVGPFMVNQLPCGVSDSVIQKILYERLSIFSVELQISRDRLARWAFSHAVLSALWDLEECSDASATFHLAQLLEKLC